MTKTLNVFLAASLVVSLAAALSFRGSASAARQDPAEVRRALVQGGLRAAAKASGGHYVGKRGWDADYTYDSLEAIVKNSDVVLVGDILANGCHLSNRGDYITTDYRMIVRETLKGDVPLLSEVVFIAMGGKVLFDDGSSATLETIGFVPPNNGARVVIFGKNVPSTQISAGTSQFAGASSVYDLVQLSRGVIELPVNEDEKVKVKATRADDPVSRQARAKSVRQFMHDLQKAVEKAEKESVDHRPAIRHR